MPKLVFIAVVAMAVANGVGWAQEEAGLALRLSRDFGYGGPNGRIQGTFSMHVSGPEEVERVVFYIDEEAIGEDSESPFRLQFRTDNYGLGSRTLHAVGYTSDGRVLVSNRLSRVFVAAEEGWREGLRIGGTIGAVAVGALVVAMALTVVAGRSRTTPPLGARRQYGLLGGTICPKCRRPFAQHWYRLRLLARAVDRCPHCGKWSVVRRMGAEALAAAEEAELEMADGGAAERPLSEEERLRKLLDESRFEEG